MPEKFSPIGIHAFFVTPGDVKGLQEIPLPRFVISLDDGDAKHQQFGPDLTSDDKQNISPISSRPVRLLGLVYWIYHGSSSMCFVLSGNTTSHPSKALMIPQLMTSPCINTTTTPSHIDDGVLKLHTFMHPVGRRSNRTPPWERTH